MASINGRQRRREPGDSANAESATAQLRALVADGLQQIDEANGGRFMSAVARRVGVNRTTVTRWRERTTTISVDHARALAGAFPEHFDLDTMLALEFRSASAGGDVDTDMQFFTAGAAMGETPTEIFNRLASSLERDRPTSERVCFHSAFRAGPKPILDIVDDPLSAPDLIEAVRRYRAAMIDISRAGWHLESVWSADSAQRAQDILQIVGRLDGPDVTIRAYVGPNVPAISMVVVGFDELFLMRDHPRWGQAASGLWFHGSRISNWSSEYYATLFATAPFSLRTPRGIDEPGSAQFLGAAEAFENAQP